MSRRRKGQMRKRNVCTYCGLPKTLTDDHVFARCLWTEVSNERSIKAKSCGDCNHKSDEGLLKSFMAMMDNRIADKRSTELGHPKNRKDLIKWIALCTPDWRKVYPTESVDWQFRKIFQGLLRHVMQDDWFFIEREKFRIFAISSENGKNAVRPWPLKVGGPNPAYELPPECDELRTDFDESFRGWNYAYWHPEILTLHYKRPDSENELLLVCFVLDERLETRKIEASTIA